MADPFDVPCDDAPRPGYPVSALMLGAALAARCEGGDHPVFPHGEEEARPWLERQPFGIPRLCDECEIRRDVVGIPLDRPGPIPHDEFQRLCSEPREMGG